MKKSNKILLGVFAIIVLLTIGLLTNLSSFYQSEDGQCGLPPHFFIFGKTIKGNGEMMTQHSSLNHFNRIHLNGNLHVILQPGKTNSLTITIDKNIIHYLIANYKNGVLSISTKPGATLLPSQPEKIIITTNAEVNEIQLGGKVNLAVDNLQTTDLDLAMGGKSHVQLTGNIKNLQITVGGKSEINAKVIQGEILRLNTSGKSQVHLSGSVNSFIITASGKTSIDAQHLIANDVIVSGAGKSNILLYANKTIIANTTAESHVQYQGNAIVSKNNEDAASVVKR
jgi:hypothetical protein